MFYRCKDLRGYAIGATDGEIGKVYDCLFDDQAWVVRYLVADAGGWLHGRQVLLAPPDIQAVDPPAQTLHVQRTRQEVHDSPSVATDLPVSRQKEAELAHYYGWPMYWAPAAPVPVPGGGPVRPGVAGSADTEQGKRRKAQHADWDPHLRSTRTVTHYTVRTRDGKMGHIEDFLVEDELWVIRFVIVDTVNWWPGKKVILSPGWIDEVNWNERSVRFDLTKQMLKAAPEYNPLGEVTSDYVAEVENHYGRPTHALPHIGAALRI